MKKLSLFMFLLFIFPFACAHGPAGQGRSDMHAESCKSSTAGEISALFERWNETLLAGDPKKVVDLYAENSILLPTVSNKPRRTANEKEDYFRHFLEKKPSGRVNERFIELGCNTAVDAGLYTFTFAETGQSIDARYTFTYRWTGSKWLITSHHSSVMPEPVK
jgi:uncharacterized protein (TIGR02246 family)